MTRVNRESSATQGYGFIAGRICWSVLQNSAGRINACSDRSYERTPCCLKHISTTLSVAQLAIGPHD